MVVGEGTRDLGGSIAVVNREGCEHHFFTAGADTAAKTHRVPVGFLVFVVGHAVVVADIFSAETSRSG